MCAYVVHVKTVQSYQTFTTGSCDVHQLPSSAWFTASGEIFPQLLPSGRPSVTPLTSHNVDGCGAGGVWGTRADGPVGSLSWEGQ